MHDMRTGTCAVCQHNQVLDAIAHEFSGKFHRQVPLAVAHEQNVGVFEKEVDHPIGILHMLVCLRCGFVQWYAESPETIPIDGETTRLITTPQRTEYR